MRNGRTTLVVLSAVVVLLLAMLGVVVATHHNQSDDANAARSIESGQTTNTPDDVAGGLHEITDNARNDRYAEPSTGERPDAVASRASSSGHLLDEGESGFSAQAQSDMQRVAADNPTQDKAAAPDNEWLTWEKAYPGRAMAIPKGDKTGTCSLGFVARKGEGFVGLTAGHCMEGADGKLQWRDSASPKLKPLGTFAVGQNRRKSLDGGFGGNTDFSAFTLDRNVRGDRKIAKTYLVDSVAQPSDLHTGMELCTYGFRTEETCGKIISSNDTFVRAAVFTKQGDSGGPAYIKKDGNRVTAVGLVSGSPNRADGTSNDQITDFALVAPLEKFLGVSIAG